jgi:hypothetical protein
MIDPLMRLFQRFSKEHLKFGSIMSAKGTLFARWFAHTVGVLLRIFSWRYWEGEIPVCLRNMAAKWLGLL